MLTFAQNLKKKLKRNMFMYRYTMQFLHKIRRKHLPFVVDEPAYGRWQRIIPKPPILSAPVTYQPILHATCTMYVSDTIEESYKNATCRWMGTSGWNLNKYILATHSMVKKREIRQLFGMRMD